LVGNAISAFSVPAYLLDAAKTSPHTSGYTENAIVHHDKLDRGVMLLSKPYRKGELARMVRLAITRGATGSTDFEAIPLADTSTEAPTTRRSASPQAPSSG
jgi:hypothetical protein